LVVVLESIFRARQTGLDPQAAARIGTSEVGTAVFMAALAQICVFGPSLFIGGIAGQVFGPMAVTVTFSRIIALLVALTLTPMMASKLLGGTRFTKEETIPGVNAPFRLWAPYDWFGKGMHILTNGYKKVLKWGIDHRKTIVVISLIMFLAVLPLIPLLGTELMPAMNTNQIDVSLTLPSGSNLVETTKTTEMIEQRIKSHQGNDTSIYAQVGGASDGQGQSSSNNMASLIVTIGNSGKQLIVQIAQDMQSYMQDLPASRLWRVRPMLCLELLTGQ
jgi:HAE1 family hydrophobic/amphiphilic exporter-1